MLKIASQFRVAPCPDGRDGSPHPMSTPSSPVPPFDALASADFLVSDRDAAVAAVQQALGFVEPKPRWSLGGPGQGFEVTFCRPNPALRHSPTLVELITDATLDSARPLTEVVP